MLELYHRVLGTELLPKADHGVRVQALLFEVAVPSVSHDVLHHLPDARRQGDGSQVFDVGWLAGLRYEDRAGRLPLLR